jgi:thiol-disulfide isomerase/thioredoxin
MKRQISLFIAISILFTVIGAYFGWKQLAPSVPVNAAVSSLLNQTLPDSQGKSQQLAQWKGKILLVNFWATWCPPCVAEMPELTALQSDLAGKNVQILGIGIDSPSNIKEFSSKYKIGYPLLVAGMVGTELSRQLGNQAGGLPFTVIIDTKGQIKKIYLGRLNIEKVREDLQSI